MKLNFLKEILSGEEGGSSKRFIAIWILTVLTIIAFAVTFFGFKLNENVWDDLYYGLLIFGGLITSEKFGKRSVRNEGSTNP
jgi:hypothetical protein